jgi:hypothetical protein
MLFDMHKKELASRRTVFALSLRFRGHSDWGQHEIYNSKLVLLRSAFLFLAAGDIAIAQSRQATWPAIGQFTRKGLMGRTAHSSRESQKRASSSPVITKVGARKYKRYFGI